VGGTATLINTTIAGNTAVDHGGGLYAKSPGVVRLNSVTIARNRANSDSSGAGGGGGIYRRADR